MELHTGRDYRALLAMLGAVRAPRAKAPSLHIRPDGNGSAWTAEAEVAVEVEVSNVSAPGAVMLPGSIFAMPFTDAASVSGQFDDGMALRIDEGTASVTWSTTPDETEAVPGIAETMHALTLPVAVLRASLGRVAHAISQEAEHRHLDCLCFDQMGGTLRAIGCDGFRLATAPLTPGVWETPASTTAPWQCLISSHACRVLRTVLDRLPKAAALTIAVGTTPRGAKVMAFLASDVRVTVPVVDGTYPDWRRPAGQRERCLATLSCDLDELQAVLRHAKASALEWHNAVRLDVRRPGPADGSVSGWYVGGLARTRLGGYRALFSVKDVSLPDHLDQAHVIVELPYLEAELGVLARAHARQRSRDRRLDVTLPDSAISVPVFLRSGSCPDDLHLVMPMASESKASPAEERDRWGLGYGPRPVESALA